jgi:hypothetical protein
VILSRLYLAKSSERAHSAGVVEQADSGWQMCSRSAPLLKEEEIFLFSFSSSLIADLPLPG